MTRLFHIKQKHKAEIKLSTLKNASQIYKSFREDETTKKVSNYGGRKKGHHVKNELPL